MNKRRNDQTPPTEYEDDYCLSGKRSTSSMMEDTGGPKQLFSVEMTLLLCLNRNTLIPTAVARNVLSFLYIRIDNTSIRDAMAIMHTDPALSLMLYGHISFWEISRVTDMSELFSNNKDFNKSIERWDVSNVTNMERMFCTTSSFNQPLEKWDVSNVTNMERMFCAASSFNQPLEKWDVSNVTNMENMFCGASSFNQPLEKWDLQSIIVDDEEEAFLP